MPAAKRSSAWIETFSGVHFDLLKPKASMVRLVDIAHHLSLQCRFAGACRWFYSVAEHSCHVHDDLLELNVWWNWDKKAPARRIALLAGLFHDSPEAYASDCPSPLKHTLRDFCAAESRIAGAVTAWLGIRPGWFEADVIKMADLAALNIEAHDLFAGHGESWSLPVEPVCDWHVECWTPHRAEREFLQRAYALGVEK